MRFTVTPLLILVPALSIAQMSKPTKTPDAKAINALPPALKTFCESTYVGANQEISKSSCLLGMTAFQSSGRDRALVECRAAHETRSRADVACRAAIAAAADITANRDAFVARAASCREQYPHATELDAYLHESCVIGVVLAFDSKDAPLKNPRLDLCEQFSDERSFLGPCGTGLSLAVADDGPTSGFAFSTAGAHQTGCVNRFDRLAFHQGYRACLNARALSLSSANSASGVVRDCGRISASKNNDTEQAACIVGASIWRNVVKSGRAENPRFRHCGDGKVQYQERERLVCLTAASLLDFSAGKEASQNCKSVFGGRRNRLRDECQRAVETIASKPSLPSPPTAGTTQPQIQKPDALSEPESINQAATIDSVEEVWPEAPDNEESELEKASANENDQGSVSDSEDATRIDRNTRAPSSETR